MRRVTEAGLEFIKGWERFRAVPYDDGYGFVTWGYGHCRVGYEPVPVRVSEDYALVVLGRDVSIAENSVVRLTHVALSDGQFDALVSLTFNVGSGAYQRSRIRMLVNRGEYCDVPVMFPRSFITSCGVRSRGLVRRRVAEGAVFKGFSAS
jgi:lysozyme